MNKIQVIGISLVFSSLWNCSYNLNFMRRRKQSSAQLCLQSFRSQKKNATFPIHYLKGEVVGFKREQLKNRRSNDPNFVYTSDDEVLVPDYRIDGAYVSVDSAHVLVIRDWLPHLWLPRWYYACFGTTLLIGALLSTFSFFSASFVTSTFSGIGQNKNVVDSWTLCCPVCHRLFEQTFNFNIKRWILLLASRKAVWL